MMQHRSRLVLRLWQTRRGLRIAKVAAPRIRVKVGRER